MLSGERIRIGFLGVGRRGLGHMRVASRFRELSLEAACDVDVARLKEVAEKYRVRTYTSLDKMLEHEKLDVMVISTPTPFHVSQTLKCICNGLDVLLEKPISLDMREVMKLLKAVEKSDKIVAVGFQSRYSNLADAAKEALDKDTLSMVAGCWYWTIPIIKWIRLRSWGGGQMVDQAIHLLDMARYLAGDVDRVYAEYTERGRHLKEDKEAGFDNWASYAVTVRFKNGAVGSFYSTYALYPGVFRIDKGVEDRATRESTVFVDFICRELLVRYVHGAEVRVYRRDRETEIHRMSGNPTENMYRAFIEAVLTRDKKTVLTPYEDSYKTMAISLAANESAVTGRPINLDEYVARYKSQI